MAFKLRQMEVFRAVMLTGSVSGAARMLYVSQPAVSKLLAHTETSLGITLFERIGGKLQPTRAARLLYDEVQDVFQAAQKVDRFIENLTLANNSEISVGSSPSLGLSLMPQVIAHYQQQNPGVRIHFTSVLIQDVALEILSGKLDVAVTVLPLENANLTVEKLFAGRMVCAIPQHHPLAEKASISIHDLTGHRTIFYSLSIPFGRLTKSALIAHGFHQEPSIDVPRAELACALVQRGLGVAIIDEFSVADNIWAGITVRPIVEDIAFSVHLVAPKFHEQSASAKSFVDSLKQCMPTSRGSDAAGA